MRALALSVVAGLTLASGCAAAGAPFWQKDWRFAPAAGDRRVAAVLAATAADHLRLAPDRIVDPLGESCGKDLSYADLRHRDRAALSAHIGRFWVLPASLDRAGSVAGWVRCGKENLAAVAFVGPHEGYRFFEDGLVIRLR